MPRTGTFAVHIIVKKSRYDYHGRIGRRSRSRTIFSPCHDVAYLKHTINPAFSLCLLGGYVRQSLQKNKAGFMQPLTQNAQSQNGVFITAYSVTSSRSYARFRPLSTIITAPHAIAGRKRHRRGHRYMPPIAAWLGCRFKASEPKINSTMVAKSAHRNLDRHDNGIKDKYSVIGYRAKREQSAQRQIPVVEK